MPTVPNSNFEKKKKKKITHEYGPFDTFLLGILTIFLVGIQVIDRDTGFPAELLHLDHRAI